MTQSSTTDDIEMEETSVRGAYVAELTREPNHPSITINDNESVSNTTSTYDGFSIPTPRLSGSISAEVPLLDMESNNRDNSVSNLDLTTRTTSGCNKRIKAVAVLIISTSLITVCADSIVSSFGALNENGILRQSFVGLIILPVVGNVAEILAASIVAARDEMGLAINIAVGSAIQIGLLMTPLTVVVGWIIQQDMTLHFDMFETATTITTTLIVSCMILRGRINYFEGTIMLVCFFGITVGAYLLPDQV
ncbi:hypothetical protein ZTR_09642 [Talaromyces verruculosus]|nr:hypothetical protein ZTR_09642 [Talaromyces verruculosus]